MKLNIATPDAEKPYLDFSAVLKSTFPYKVQKISIDAGFTCPNRDGSKGVGGCTYCNNQTFSPAYCHRPEPVAQQVERGKAFFAHKYPQMKYLAYFQAYSNSYADLSTLQKRYEEALSVPGVVGLVIATRPDCMPEELLRYLERLATRWFVFIEFGVESTIDETLRSINRGHDFATATDTIQRTHQHGLPMGAHLIIGLPGEHRQHIIRHACQLSALPLTSIKLHQLQIVKGTRMAADYRRAPEAFNLFSTPEEYIEEVICFLEHLAPGIAVDRFVSQSPPGWVIAPSWGIKNHEFVHRLEKRMKDRRTYQGRCYNLG